VAFKKERNLREKREEGAKIKERGEGGFLAERDQRAGILGRHGEKKYARRWRGCQKNGVREGCQSENREAI